MILSIELNIVAVYALVLLKYHTTGIHDIASTSTASQKGNV